MKEYDVIVIGAGTGLTIAFEAQTAKLTVALIDKGNVGGTCLNVGCVPSKMLIYIMRTESPIYSKARRFSCHHGSHEDNHQ